jgi:hypothetical protein
MQLIHPLNTNFVFRPPNYTAQQPRKPWLLFFRHVNFELHTQLKFEFLNMGVRTLDMCAVLIKLNAACLEILFK